MSPLVWSLAALSTAVCYLLLSHLRHHREIANLRNEVRGACEAARGAWLSSYALLPEDEKAKLPPEWRSFFDEQLQEMAGFGATLVQHLPSEVLPKVVDALKTNRPPERR